MMQEVNGIQWSIQKLSKLANAVMAATYNSLAIPQPQQPCHLDATIEQVVPRGLVQVP